MTETIQAKHHTAEYWENAEPADSRLGPPSHPGELLKEEYLDPLGVSISRLASDIGISYRRAHEIVSGKRGITAETALLLAKYFRMSPQFWLGLQADYELELLRGQMQDKMARVRVLPRPDLEPEGQARSRSEQAKVKLAVPAERAGGTAEARMVKPARRKNPTE
jgi:addiction module HigA family antidote